jgi:hypothetical protein
MQEARDSTNVDEGTVGLDATHLANDNLDKQTNDSVSWKRKRIHKDREIDIDLE